MKKILAFLLSLLFICPLAYSQTNISGKAISFNGTTGYLSVPNGVWFGSGDFTIEAWVYVRSHQNWARLIDFSNGANHDNVYLALSGNNFGCPTFGLFGGGLASSSQADSPVPLPLNQWTHLAVVFAGGGTTIYINGKVAINTVLNTKFASGVTRTNCYIGRSPYPGDGYPDAIFDDIRIWDVYRTQGQIQANMNHPLGGNEDNLVAYWRADEGSGPSAFSTVTNNPGLLIANGGTANLVGSASWVNSGALITPPANYALAFTNTIVTIPHQSYQNAYPLTVMCWYCTSAANGAMVNKYVSSSLNGWQLAFGSQVHAWYYHDSFHFIGNTVSGVGADGLWHHAAWVVDSTSGRLYIDGFLMGTNAWTGGPGASTTSTPISLGIYQGDSLFTGGIDEVSIWNTALSAAQIQYYRNYAPHGNEPGLIGLYRMNEGIGTNVFDGSANLNAGYLSSPPPIWIPSSASIHVPPSITVTQAVTYKGNSATLTSIINPNGSATAVWSAYYTFQQGFFITNLYSGSIGNSSNDISVPLVFNNLSPSTAYDVYIIASNAADRVVSGDYRFTTPSGFAPSLSPYFGSTGYTNANISINVSPNSAPATVIFTYGTTANYGNTNIFTNISSPQTVLDVITNLQMGTAYHLAVTATNIYGSTSSGDGIFFTSAAAAPLLTNVAANVTFTNTTLSALINPNGGDTTVWLAYGSTTGYGNTNITIIPGGAGAVPISQVLSNLPIQSSYHFTVTASNSLGTVSSGDIPFSTPSYLLGMATLIEPSQGGSDSIVLGGVPSGISWSASATVPWVHLNSFTNGVGSQTVLFDYDQNPGGPRNGAIQFGSQTVNIIQAGDGYLQANAVLDLAVSPHLGGYMALDQGNNVYFTTNDGNQISRIDYLTKSITPLYSSPNGYFFLRLDAATNLYFSDQFGELFKMPLSTGTAVPLVPFTGGIFNMAVSSSGDLYFQNPGQGISLLPHSTNTPTVIIPGTVSLIPTWTLDPGDNLYVYYFTNAISSGTAFQWSPDTLSLVPIFSTFFPASIYADGSGNIDLNYSYVSGTWSPLTDSFSYSYPQHTNSIYSSIVDNRGDTFTLEASPGNVYFIREYPRAFVNGQNIAEGSAAGSDSVAVVVPTNTYVGGSLTPTSSASWLTVNGVTNGTITFSFSAFAGQGNRTAYLKIMGVNVAVTQGSPTYSLGANATAEPPAAGADSVVIAASPALANWTATANNPWLHLAPNMQSGSGSGPIVFSFDTNPGATRTGSLTLGGQTFTVTQAGSTYVQTASLLPVGTSTNTIYSLAVDSGGNLVGAIYQYLGGSAFSEELWNWLRASNAVTYSSVANTPGVAGDWLGNIYVTVFSGSPPYVAQRYNPTNHTFTTVMSSPVYQPGTESSEFAVDKQGNIIFVDENNGGLVEFFQATGEFQQLDPGPFSLESMTIDPAGNVFWSDNDSTIKEWNATSLQVSIVLSNLTAFSVAADAGGNLFYSDGGAGQLKKLSAVDGSVTPVPTDGLFPSAIAFDPAGNLYFAFNTGSGCDIREIPRAFVDTTPKIESLASGQDVLSPVVLTNANLLPPFSPSSDQPWLTINNVTNGVVKFAFTSTGSARVGNLMVLGQRIVVTQGTNYTLGTTNLLEGPAAGLDSFVFGTIPASATWSASTNAAWLHFTNSGTGGGNQIFSYDANPGPTRSGTITIAGKTLTITQAGASYVAANPQLTLLTDANGLGAPCGVALDAKGNVFIADTYNSAIKVWNPTNNQISTLVSTGLNTPYALTVDGAGNVYIADTFNSLLKKWSPVTSNVTTIVSSGLAYPIGAASDAAGNVYLADANNDAIKKWSPADSSIITLYSSPGVRPKGVAVDAIGNVYWVELGTGRVREWLAQSNSVITLFTPAINDPYAVAVDGRGNVYMADYGLATTYEWIAASNTVIARAGNTIGVAVDAAGNQFIASAIDSHIYEVPRAFVDPTQKNESLAAGHDAVAPVLPTNEDLLPPFAPQSSQPWLSITGVTNGAVSFAYSASANARFGTISILGQSIIVNQGTNLVLGTMNLTEGPRAGSDSFVLGAIPAAWTASANVPWLHVPASGIGSGNVIFSFDANSGPTRSGTITIGSLSLTVTQAGSTYVLASPPTYLAGGNAPCGVAVDAAGNVFFCDTYNSAVRVWCPTNNQVSTIGDTGFNTPYALAVDHSGNVFIADTYNNVLKKWSVANSNITTVVTNLITPFGVAADSAGNIYIGDTGNDSVKEWFPATNGIITLYTNAGTSPRGVAVDAIGNVYWVEGPGQVRKWSVVTNTVTTVFNFGPCEPRGVAVDGSGNVYLADYCTALTYKWSAASNTVSALTNGTIGVSVDANGNQFIADAGGFQIYEVPRAFVDPSTRIVSPAGGQDALPPILPANEDLLVPFQPLAADGWINLTGNSGGAVHFTFPSSAIARASSISLYGYSITILQTNNAFPPFLTGMQRTGPATMQFRFTNNPNGSFTVLASTNVSLPFSNWTVLGTATNLSNNLYQFTDPSASNPATFYRVRSP